VLRISSFLGIDIWMYHDEHGVAHFHANYAEHWVTVSMESFDVLGGSLPGRALRFVREWSEIHQEELRQNWLARNERPFSPIPPLE
jgi:hypothetical protein